MMTALLQRCVRCVRASLPVRYSRYGGDSSNSKSLSRSCTRFSGDRPRAVQHISAARAGTLGRGRAHRRTTRARGTTITRTRAEPVQDDELEARLRLPARAGAAARGQLRCACAGRCVAAWQAFAARTAGGTHRLTTNMEPSTSLRLCPRRSGQPASEPGAARNTGATHAAGASLRTLLLRRPRSARAPTAWSRRQNHRGTRGPRCPAPPPRPGPCAAAPSGWWPPWRPCP